MWPFTNKRLKTLEAKAETLEARLASLEKDRDLLKTLNDKMALAQAAHQALMDQGACIDPLGHMVAVGQKESLCLRCGKELPPSGALLGRPQAQAVAHPPRKPVDVHFNGAIPEGCEAITPLDVVRRLTRPNPTDP